MSFQRAVPKSVAELRQYLDKINANRSHVRGITVNPANGHLEVKLDGMAHFAGNPDVYLPIKKSRINDATALVDRILRDSAGGFPPGDSTAQELFDMLDPSGICGFQSGQIKSDRFPPPPSRGSLDDHV